MSLSRILKEKVFILIKNRAKSISLIQLKPMNIKLLLNWLLNWVSIKIEINKINHSFQSKKFKIKITFKVYKLKKPLSVSSLLKLKKLMNKKWWKMKTLIFKNPRLKIALKNPEPVQTVIVVVKIMNSKIFYYLDLSFQNRSL